MTVYVEYVLIDNFFIDFMLFKTAFKITGKTVSRWRIAVCSALGAVFALVYPLLTESVIIISAAKILFGLLLTFCAAKFSCLKDYAAFTAVFMGLTFFTGGIITGVFLLFGLNASAEYSVALMALPVFVAVSAINRLIRFLYRRKNLSAFAAETEIAVGGKTVKLRGFFDTGNGLYKGLSPVIVVSKRAVESLIGVTLMRRAEFIEIKTLGGKKRKICFTPDSVVIYSGKERHIYYNVAVAVTEDVFDGYDAILHPALTESKYEREISVKTEKAS